MTTWNEMISSALQRIAVVQTGEAPSGSEYTDGIRSMNRMVAGWRLQGLYLPFSPVDTQDGGSTVTFDEDELDAIEANLALRLCNDYGKRPTPLLVAEAGAGWNGLYAKHGQTLDQKVDAALLPSRRSGVFRRITT